MFYSFRGPLWATLWFAFSATIAVADDHANIIVSLEDKLQAVYDITSPAIVKIRRDATDERVLAEGVIVAPEGYVLLRNTLELWQQFRDRRSILFTLSDGRELKGATLGWSDEWGIAMAKISANGARLCH
jgi:hypothetical protein